MDKGPLKTYDVSGMDVLGNGKPAPAGTVLRLSRAHAERLGLEKKQAEPQLDPEQQVRKAPARKAAARRRPATPK